MTFQPTTAIQLLAEERRQHLLHDALRPRTGRRRRLRDRWSRRGNR